MKITLINKSDTSGGAAIVSLRLIHALQAAGVEAKMLVAERNSNDATVEAVGGKWQNKWNFLAERLGIFLRNGLRRDTLFRIDTASCGLDLSKHPDVRTADAVILGWVNQGMLSLKSVERIAALGKPVLWVMHDMWNCTGVCHHAFDCPNYQSLCSDCHLYGNHAATTQRQKRALYQKAGITFVATSSWVKGVAQKSAIMHDQHIVRIPNAFPIDAFSYEKTALPPTLAAHPTAAKIVVMGARRLDEENKGFPQMLDAMRYIATEKPALAQQMHLLLYGDIKDASLLAQIAVPYTHVGAVDVSQINALYRCADVVLSTSQFETLPTTLIEGQASGCIPVTFGKGGQADIVDHLKTGFIAQYNNPASVAEGLEWAFAQPVSREALHRDVERKFGAAHVAQQFINLVKTEGKTPKTNP